MHCCQWEHSEWISRLQIPDFLSRVTLTLLGPGTLSRYRQYCHIVVGEWWTCTYSRCAAGSGEWYFGVMTSRIPTNCSARLTLAWYRHTDRVFFGAIISVLLRLFDNDHAGRTNQCAPATGWSREPCGESRIILESTRFAWGKLHYRLMLLRIIKLR